MSFVKAVIFDMDGVLTDSEPLINAAAVAMFRERGLVVQPEDFLPFVGTGEDRYLGGVARAHLTLLHVFQIPPANSVELPARAWLSTTEFQGRVEGCNKLRCARVAQKYGFPLDIPAAKRRTYEIYLDLVPRQLEAFPGARELVQACRRAGLKTAVASSADLIKINANLRQIGLPPETWNALVSAEDATHKKPAPDLFLAAARKLGVTPAECIVIEDAVNGIQAAKAARMRCVAVAQTFAAAKLHAADLVRESLLQVTLADLAIKPR